MVVGKLNGDISFFLDMRQANHAVLREKHPLPSVEETLHEISEVNVFSKLDLIMEFHKIELHTDSREATAFAHVAADGLYSTRVHFSE